MNNCYPILTSTLLMHLPSICGTSPWSLALLVKGAFCSTTANSEGIKDCKADRYMWSLCSSNPCSPSWNTRQEAKSKLRALGIYQFTRNRLLRKAILSRFTQKGRPTLLPGKCAYHSFDRQMGWLPQVYPLQTLWEWYTILYHSLTSGNSCNCDYME